jgi:molybdopterin converting factor small subunit
MMFFTMNVTVELQAYLAQYSPEDDKPVFELELPEGATVAELIRKLKLPDELASIIIVSDDATASTTHPLKDGDYVTVIPPLAGG